MKLRYFNESGFPLTRGTEHSAGLDVYHCGEDTKMYPGVQFTARTGLYVEIPEGHVGLIVPRSGLGMKGIVLVNTVGVIDSDYRGEIGMKLVNTGSVPVEICYGDRVAQLLIVPYAQLEPEGVQTPSALTSSERGANGFGSTGR